MVIEEVSAKAMMRSVISQAIQVKSIPLDGSLGRPRSLGPNHPDMNGLIPPVLAGFGSTVLGLIPVLKGNPEED